MIAIIGCGTLGSRVAPQLQEHELLLIDHDTVKPGNLPQQHYRQADVGKKKARVTAQNTGSRAITEFLNEHNIDLLQEAEVIIDCTDNLHTRNILGTYAYKEGIPLVHGAAAANKGIAALFTGKPCLESLYHDKISIEHCRSNNINTTVADKLARKQVLLTHKALRGEEHDGIHIITPKDERTVHLSMESQQHCKKELPSNNYYFTWCTVAQCISAKPIKKTAVTPKKGTARQVRYELLGSGEVRFYDDAEIDDLQRILQELHVSHSKTS